MGFFDSIGSVLGLGDNQGANYKPQSAPLMNLTSPEQLAQAQKQSNDALAQQQAFLAAVQAQGGLGKQTDVYNQYGDIAAGRGANPAQAMLANATGANTANQAALMASQRGASANPALLARLAAQQGAANQQGAAGQAALLQAQQSLAALGQQGGLANQMAGQQAQAVGNLNQFAQGNQGQQFGAANAQNNANLSNTQGMNTILANQALDTQRYQQKGLSGLASGISSVAGTLPGMLGGGGGGAGTMTGTAGSGAGGMFGTSASGLAGPPTMAPGATGGKVTPAGIGTNPRRLADGGMPSDGIESFDAPGPRSYVGKLLAPESKDDSGGGGGGSMAGTAMQLAPLLAARGGKVPALLSPGEKYLSPEQAKKVAQGKESPMKGKTVPGNAKVKGDSLKNDTVKANLDAGGIVIPRSVMQSKDPAGEAAKFVQAVMAKHGMKGKA
jgi:hypothetical protein